MHDAGHLERVHCPYCGSDVSRPWVIDNGYTAVQCENCSFVYVNPRPSLNSITEASRTGLHETESGRLNVIGPLGFRKSKQRMFERRLRDLFFEGDLIGERIRWLDIGAGFGELLAAVETLAGPGSRVEGIEPNETKVAVAQKRGLQVTTQALSEVRETFGFVSLVNVFSHLPDPGSYIKDLANVLAPDGHLFLVTGNAADITADQFPNPFFLPNHLVFAGEKHIRGFLERSGFDVLKIRAYKDFLHEPAPLILLKNLARKALGRPPMPLRNPGPYRSLFIHAQVKTGVLAS